MKPTYYMYFYKETRDTTVICDTNALEQTEVSFKTGPISFLLFGTTYMYTADVCVLTDMFTNTTYDMYF